MYLGFFINFDQLRYNKNTSNKNKDNNLLSFHKYMNGFVSKQNN